MHPWEVGAARAAAALGALQGTGAKAWGTYVETSHGSLQITTQVRAHQAERATPHQVLAELPCSKGRARSSFRIVHAHVPVVGVILSRASCCSVTTPAAHPSSCQCQLPQNLAGCSSQYLCSSPALARRQQPLAEGRGGELRTLNPRIDRGFLECS